MSGEKISIADLASNPPWLKEVAYWHHLQWQLAKRNAGFAQEISAEREQDLLEREKNMLAHFSDSPFPRTFVAHCGQKCIGCVSLVNYSSKEQTGKGDFWITNLFVLANWRKQGVGSALLNFALGYADDCGLTKLQLFTKDKRRFYEQRGWCYNGSAKLQGEQVTILAISA